MRTPEECADYLLATYQGHKKALEMARLHRRDSANRAYWRRVCEILELRKGEAPHAR